MRRVLVLLSAICGLYGCSPTGTARHGPKYVPMEMPPGLPFSSSVQVGRMLYLSGQIGTDSGGRLVSGGIEAETRQTMENIRAALERGGSTMDHVVKCTAMLADMADWAAMNRVYVNYFPKHLPTRSAFGTSGLALGARVEIECWAAMP
jgi:2-iminobutanoate/2-iminopropanoate deaminase